MIRQIPNLITALRLVLAPVVWYFIWQREYEWALACGVIASASDAVDGYLARRLKAESKFGLVADPLADKLLLSGSYAAFGLSRTIPAWAAGVVVGRDILILAVAMFVARFSKVREFPPSVWGKLSTFVQIMTGLAILLKASRGGDVYLHQAEYWMLRICAAATLWSGVHYSWAVCRKLRE